MKHPGHRRQRRIEPEQQGNQTQVTDGGKRQQPFQIVLEQGPDRPPQQRGHAGSGNQVEPQVGACQYRVEPRQQKDACLDHGGRMQIRTHRGRGRHGVGQPEMERELGTLGEGPQQYQTENHRVEGMLLHQGAVLQHRAQRETAHHMANQQHPGQQRQTAHTGDRQRHASPLTGSAVVLFVADQQEGTKAGQFPEEHQKQQIVAGHHPQHAEHEQQQQGIETAAVILGRQVIVRIHHHQQPDTQNQDTEQQRQTIQPQRQIQSQRGQPGHGPLLHPPFPDRQRRLGQQPQGSHHRQRHQQGAPAPPQVAGKHGQKRRQ